jgi:hypothetical protein
MYNFQIQSSNPEAVIFSHGTPDTWQYIYSTRSILLHSCYFKIKFFPWHSIMTLRYTGDVKAKLNAMFISVVHGGQLSASRSGRFSPEESALFTQLAWTWMGSRVGLEDSGKRINFCTKSNPWRLAVVSLYWLSYFRKRRVYRTAQACSYATVAVIYITLRPTGHYSLARACRKKLLGSPPEVINAVLLN